MFAASFTRVWVVFGSTLLSTLPFHYSFAQHDSPEFVPSAWSTSPPAPDGPAQAAEARPASLPAHLVVVRFPAEMLAGMIDRQIDITTTVNDVILGTPVTGVARLVGQPRVELCPSDDQARFRVVVKGTVYSRTIGHGGQANIHGHSVTQFIATKEVIYEPGEGFRSLPPQVTANTQCFTDSIVPSRGGLVGRVIQRRASEQVAAQRNQLTAIARQRATARIQTAFENRMKKRIAQLNQTVDFQIQLASLRQREGTRRLCARTTPHFLELADSIDSSAQIELPPRQLADSGTPSIEIWVRSSLIPEKLGDNLQTIFTNPDQSAALNALAVLPGTLGKKAAAIITALASENKIGVQNLGEWLVIDLNTAGKPTVAARISADSPASARR
jgi:hypothetical protein